MQNRTKGFIFALPILLIIGLLWSAYFFYTLSPLEDGQSAVPKEPFLIVKGDGLKDIAQKLEAGSYIRSASAFKFYSLVSGQGHQLKPGLYNLNSSSSTTEIVDLLVAGPAKEIEVLITEGESLKNIDARLSQLGIIQAGDFKQFNLSELRSKYAFLAGARSLEGYLFPDTYRFYFASTPNDAVRPFLENFKNKVEPLIADGTTADFDSIPITRRGIYSIGEIVTIASLLEKEVPEAEDRRMVADIMYRRLKISMPLQIDASVDYAKLIGDPRYDTYQFY
jgi:UPF0755 protein